VREERIDERVDVLHDDRFDRGEVAKVARPEVDVLATTLEIVCGDPDVAHHRPFGDRLERHG
jgi:hypothetical protein